MLSMFLLMPILNCLNLPLTNTLLVIIKSKTNTETTKN